MQSGDMDARPFNVFQRVMRLWDMVHPYNAAQVIQLRGQLSPQRLEESWRAMLKTLGLGKVTIEGQTFRHQTCPPDAPEHRLTIITDSTLEAFIAKELNHPFETYSDQPHTFCPLRAFALQQGDCYYAGVIYHHWVADSASIRMLLREWFFHLYEPARARNTPLKIAEGGYWRFFGPTRAGWKLDDAIWTTLRLTTRFCNSRRVEHHGEDYSVACAMQHLPDGMIDRLRDAARQKKVKLNDIFLAATAEACDREGITRPLPGQQELAMGTIADLRTTSREDLSDTFGLFLGFTTHVARPDALRDWPRLVDSLGRQSAYQKEGKLAQSSLLRMGAAIAESLFLTPRTWVRFYQHHMPLSAGISNVNMTQSWAAQYHPDPILDYLRFSPTGPALPVVFTPSSLGHRSHVALTYRVELLGHTRAQRMMESFIRRMTDLASGRC